MTTVRPGRLPLILNMCGRNNRYFQYSCLDWKKQYIFKCFQSMTEQVWWLLLAFFILFLVSLLLAMFILDLLFTNE